MSRLDSFIGRMTAQRDYLDHIASHPLLPDTGDVFEIGLGNGRTYSHLREKFPDRRIIVFDRVVMAHSSCIPEDENMVIGEIAETAQKFIGSDAAFAHADIGSGNEEIDAITLQWLPQAVFDLIAHGGLAMSCGMPLPHARLKELSVPDTISSQRCFVYQKI